MACHIAPVVDIARLAMELGHGPRVEIQTREKAPCGARARFLVQADAATVWSQIKEPANLANLIRMIESVTVLAGRDASEQIVRVDLKFKIALFSARFDFVAAARIDDGRVLELEYREGKVRDVRIRLEVVPVDAEQSILDCSIGFDIMSLGWLVKTFLRHHPEIEWGVHAGSVLTVCSSIQEAAEQASKARF